MLLLFSDYKHSNQVIQHENESLILSNTSTQFNIQVKINPTTTIMGLSCSGVKFKLKRNSIGLLKGSFYIPTGSFAILAMASYVINPDAVSLTCNSLLFSEQFYL